jgi:hypothetical protein
VSVEIRDNGPGLSLLQAAKATEGLGFRLVQALVRQVSGTVEYLSSDMGLTVCLTLPHAIVIADEIALRRRDTADGGPVADQMMPVVVGCHHLDEPNPPNTTISRVR